MSKKMKSVHFSFGKIITISIITFFLITSCDVTDPKKDKPKPEGYQEDILWPSLADSPWPMFQHDPQFSGRSKYSGPASGSIFWELDSLSIETAVVLGKDSSLNFITSSHIGSLAGGLYCVNSFLGTKKWTYPINLIANNPSPLVTADGTTIFSTYYDGKIIAVTRLGNLKWSYDSKSYITSGNINIGRDGTIFFVDSTSTLFALNENGKLDWKLKLETAPFYVGISFLAFAPNGKTLFVTGYNSAIYAVDIETKSIKWSYGQHYTKSPPMVVALSNIYMIIGVSNNKQYLVKIDANGKEKWRYYFGSRTNPYLAIPCIDKMGNIAFGFDSLYSIDFNGNLRWKVNLNSRTISSPLTCDINGSIYIGLENQNNSQVVAFNNEGNIIWESAILEGHVGDSPAIQNGLLFYPTYRSKKLYAIK